MPRLHCGCSSSWHETTTGNLLTLSQTYIADLWGLLMTLQQHLSAPQLSLGCVQ